ncbi:MAG: hypothetical protein HQL13_06895, partial [Candidatus Omnitrophica bacterium]|nr:hypothetical protein [Candidatus Omnitrophota bacterium]
MLLHSIRFKIVLWHIFILSLAMLTFGTLLYQGVHRKMSQDMDYILRSRARGIVQSIDTYWETKRLQVISGESKPHFTKEGNTHFIKIARRWVEEKSSDPNLISIIVRIFDAHGNPIASSKAIPIEHLYSRTFNDVKKGAEHFENASFTVNDKPSSFRLFTTPV